MESFKTHQQRFAAKGIVPLNFHAVRFKRSEREAIYAAIRQSSSRIFYMPPYTEQHTPFLQFLRKLPGSIRHVVIEKADRISREDAYCLLQDSKPKAVICQTDQDSEEATQQICESFMIGSASIIRLSGVIPPKLELRAIYVPRSHQKYSRILHLLVCSCGHPDPHCRLKTPAGDNFAFVVTPLKSLIPFPQLSRLRRNHAISFWTSTLLYTNASMSSFSRISCRILAQPTEQ